MLSELDAPTPTHAAGDFPALRGWSVAAPTAWERPGPTVPPADGDPSRHLTHLSILVGSFELPTEDTKGFGAEGPYAITIGAGSSEPDTLGTAPIDAVGAPAGATLVVDTELNVDLRDFPVTPAADPSPARSFDPSPRATGLARGASNGGPRGQTIVAREIYKGFGSGRDRTPIVRGVSLSVAAGETVFLVGPSGSGKTTLLSVLGCILTPDRGAVEVLGRDISGMSRADLAAFRRQHLGFIFQTFNLFPTLSALDNVRIVLAMRGVAPRAARARAAELLDRVGLSHRLRTKPTRLSTGESQRVAIARALAGKPAVLLADEPTASLDAENGQAVMAMLSGLARDGGLTLLIVTHDNRIEPFADRILRLEDGRLAGPEGGVAVPQFDQVSVPGGMPKESTT